MSLSKVVIKKQPYESRLCSMEFSNKMSGVEEISTIDDVLQFIVDSAGNSTVTTDLVITGEVVSGTIAQFLVAGGVIPTRKDIKEQKYKITVRVTTDTGQELENDGFLLVRED